MLQSDDVGGAPLLDFESWRALLRSNCGRDVEVTAPNDFAGWRRPFNVCGLEATSVEIRWGSADAGSSDHRVERYRDVRCDGADHYLILFQVAGQTAMTQMDQEAQLAVGDVALVDAARPVTYLFSGDWLTLRLPRKSVRSHFGFEPQGGVSRQRTRASRLLFDLIRNADMEAASSSADIYMQFAVYDLVGALFAPSDPRSLARGSDKLFQRICGVIKDGFSDPDFGPVEVAAEAGVSLRYVQKLLTERGTTCSEFIYSSRLDHAAHLLHRRALLGTGEPLSEIAYACGSRLCAFRAEIPQAVWLFAALDRTIERRIKSNSDDRMLELCFFSQTREAIRAAPEGRRGLAVAKSRVVSQFEFSALGAKPSLAAAGRPAERA